MIKINYNTKIRNWVCEPNSRANALSGINIEKLSEEERESLVLFGNESWHTIIVEKEKKHTLVHDGSKYIGLVVSNNEFGKGENYLKQYKVPVRYVRLTDNFIADYELVV